MANLTVINSSWFPTALGLCLMAGCFGFMAFAAARMVQERRARMDRESRQPGYSVFAKIMGHALPMDRGDRYENPLNQALESRGFGRVTGGGTRMDRNGSVEWFGIDVELCNLQDALEFTRQRLQELGAPPGSVLEYRVGDQKITVEIA